MLTNNVTGEKNHVLCISFLQNKQFSSYDCIFKLIKNMNTVLSKNQKLKIRACLTDGEINIPKAICNSFEPEFQIQCDFHLKRTGRSEINKLYYKSKSSPIRKGDKILINCAYGIILVATFLPKPEMLDHLLVHLGKIRCNKKPGSNKYMYAAYIMLFKYKYGKICKFRILKETLGCY